MEWREHDGVRWLEADLGGGRAAFPARLGGASRHPFDSLNLASLTGDDHGAVISNRRRLAAALGATSAGPKRISFARQVHGATLCDRRAAAAGFSASRWFSAMDGSGGEDAGAPEADGHVLRDADDGGALVFVADCLPIALAGPDGVAILHCGWRGLAAGIVADGAGAVGATRAAVGPGIGPCCYQVGAEVIDAFSPLGTGVADGRMLDLVEVARLQLMAAGVERIEVAGICTCCESELFFSHRRDRGATGRQAGLAWIVGD
jgi:purine-nucleoside/S-methyl-5'-thioadenosine phosphorylase / adenosine deaminase